MLNLFAALVVGSTPASSHIDTLRYEIAVARGDSRRRALDVRVRFRARPDGRTPIELPHSWTGYTDLENQVSALRLAGDRSATLSDSDANHVKIVRSRPSAQIELRYRLQQDWSGTLRRPEYFRAIIGERYSLLVAQNALVHPTHADGDSLAIEFTWKNLLRDWRVSTSFGEGTTQRAHTTIEDLLESAFAAVPATPGIGGTAYTNALVMYADTTSTLRSFAEAFGRIHRVFRRSLRARIRISRERRLHREGQ